MPVLCLVMLVIFNYLFLACYTFIFLLKVAHQLCSKSAGEERYKNLNSSNDGAVRPW